MKPEEPLQPCLVRAIAKMSTFITTVTGREPTQEELAAALGRFFVLEEVKAFIQMEREREPGKK